MPAGQNYPGQTYVLDPEVHDGLITYNAGVASKTPALATTAPALPGSGTAATNTNAFNVNVYVYGGTVTSAAISGGTIATSTGFQAFLKPGDTITMAYSAPGGGGPFWYWQSE